MRPLALVLVCSLAALVRGQELLWEVHTQSGVKHGGVYPEFGDYDGDGAVDVLVACTDYRGAYPLAMARILSGTDGSLLDEMVHPYPFGLGWWTELGDFDRDGKPDVLVSGPAYGTVEIWSIARRKKLLHLALPVASGSYGTKIRALDCTGDGMLDLVFGEQTGTAILVHDHSGALLYSIPASPAGFLPVDIMGVGDLDGDGCDDFLAGCAEFISGQGLGAVILFSGRSGSPLRVHWGQQPFDFLNRDLRVAGDVDGDGVTDYAAGNYTGVRGIVVVWSGATGQVIRQWVSNDPRYLGGLFLAGVDVDLDGRPDILDVAGGYPNIPGSPATQGRVRSLSSRDGQDLVHVASTQWTNYYADTYANLGVQPGNPYPVFAISDTPIVPLTFSWPRIRAYRLSPLGTRLVGAGCSSTAVQPTIGIRRVDATPTDHSRLVLGSAPANAFAVCVAAPTSLPLAAPVPLDFLGLPGCNLLVAPAITELRLTGAASMDRGYAAFDFPAAMAATGGVEFAAQWVVLDPVTLGHATTQRYEFRVQ